MTDIRRSDGATLYAGPELPEPAALPAPEMPAADADAPWLSDASCERLRRLGATLLGAPVVLVRGDGGPVRRVIERNGDAGIAAPDISATLVLTAASRATTTGVPVTDSDGAHRVLAMPIAGVEEWPAGALVVVGEPLREWVERDRTLAGELADIASAEIALRSAVAAHEETEGKRRHDALHDRLTGLANRPLFMDRLSHAIRRARRRDDARFVVLCLDLDRFKVVNDSLGHEAGDILLATVARRLLACMRDEDTVARLGGDEFAILVEAVEDEHDAGRIADRIQAALSAPVNVGGYDVFTSASIGIVTSDANLDHAEQVIGSADTAMYRAKTSGRARYEMFDRDMHARALARLKTETDLRHAIEREEFVVHYQPIISLATGRVSGFEALVRWQHPERGLVPPLEFIPLAEEMGLIVTIGRFVLLEACRQLHDWLWRFPQAGPLAMAVNLSPKQFSQPNLVDHVAEALREYELEPSSLRLEITEHVIVENAAYASAMLEQLQQLGVQVYLDDFGTGYSSLSYLHRLPLDAIKIDREFVDKMTTSAKAFQLVDVVRTLAQNLGGITIAEGVETKEQLVALRDLGCEHAQGFLFSRPLDPSAIETLLGRDPRW